MRLAILFLNNGIIRGFILGLFLLVVSFVPNKTLANDFSDWSHGASGYKHAIQEAKNEDKPLILYFHKERCKWSRKMTKNYLASYDVKAFLRGIPKVEINPDKGAMERE